MSKRFKGSHGNTRPKGGKKAKKVSKPAVVVAAPAKKTATKK